MTAHLLKIGARGSPLSLAQTDLVISALTRFWPGLAVGLKPIQTTGDKLLDVSLAKVGGKGLFVKEIEEALFSGEIDLAVHSAKDLPSDLPDGLVVGAVLERADFRDVLISRNDGGLAALPPGAVVGTSGLRRKAQLLALRPDLVIEPIRGNVATRLKKLTAGYSATLLAAAGLNRLGIDPPGAEFLAPEVMLPAAGQGSLALEVRRGDQRVLELIEPLNHQPTALALAAERGFLRCLGSGCQLPVAALAQWADQVMTLTGLIASLDGGQVVRGSLVVEADSLAAASEFGRSLALDLLERGGREIMRGVEGL